MDAAAAQHLGARVRPLHVWSGNADAELGHLRRLIRDFPLVVVAFAAQLPRAASRQSPATPDARYAALRADFDAARVVQLLLALHARDGAVGRAWRFHLCDLTAEDLRFLARVGVDADDRLARCVNPHRLGAALVASGAVLNPAVTWMAHNPDVAAYMVRCVTGVAQLPPTLEAFDRLRNAYFPVFYDQERLRRLRAARNTQANGAASTSQADGAASTTQANGAASTTQADGAASITQANGAASTTQANGAANST